MNAIKPLPSKENLAVTHVLMALLERLEHSSVPIGADQYRSVVMHLVHEISDITAGQALGVLLDTHPAAAEVYENINYEVAGLCRSPLDQSLAAEIQAKAIIKRAMSQSK